MKLSELAKQIEDYIAENGDADVRTIYFGDECYAETREPVFEVEAFGKINVITL